MLVTALNGSFSVPDNRSLIVPALLRPRAAQERVSGQHPRHQEGNVEIGWIGVYRYEYIDAFSLNLHTR